MVWNEYSVFKHNEAPTRSYDSYDVGLVTLKLGREEPAVSMDHTGKILWARHSEIQHANLKTLDAEVSEAIQDGERLSLSGKDLRLVKSIHNSCSFLEWDLCLLAMMATTSFTQLWPFVTKILARLSNSFGKLKFKHVRRARIDNFKEDQEKLQGINKINLMRFSFLLFCFHDYKQICTDVDTKQNRWWIFAAARSVTSFYLYALDWENCSKVRRIEFAAKHIYWSDSGEMIAVRGEDSFCVLNIIQIHLRMHNPEKSLKMELRILLES